MNKSFGLISIIMAAYNAEKTIEVAIQSVIKQTYENWELIVVNDCSQDSTLEIVYTLAKSESRIRVINNPVNCGASQTRHNGLMQVRGEWVAILDSDDMWTSDKLEKQISLQEETGAELLFTGSAFMNDDGQKLDWILQVPEKIGYKQLLKQNLISNSSALLKTDLFKQYEAIGDNMHEDFACWLQILKTGRVAYGIDEPLLIYRLAKKSKSSNKFKAALMNLKTYRFIKLSIFEQLFYMSCYIIRSINKYINLRKW